MLNCNRKDKLIDLLKTYGYFPVALPRKGIVPLQIIERVDDGYQITSKTTELFVPNGEYKAPSLPKLKPALGKISGQKSNEIDGRLGLSIMKDWISALGGNIDLQGNYNNVDKVIFEFNNLKVRELYWSKLDKYINTSKLNFDSKAFIQKVIFGKLHVITSILLSNSFTVQMLDKNGKNIGGEFKQRNFGKLKVNVNQDIFENTKIEYVGEDDLVFGIKAVKLRYEEGEQGDYFFNIINSKREVLRTEGEENLAVEILKDDVNFINI